MTDRKEFYHVHEDEHCTRRLRTVVATSHEQAFLDWWFEATNGLGSAYVQRASDHIVRQFVGELVVTEIAGD